MLGCVGHVLNWSVKAGLKIMGNDVLDGGTNLVIFVDENLDDVFIKEYFL